MDAVQGTFVARFRTVEKLDGVGVEREPLEELYCLLWEDVVQLKDVDDHVDEGASNDEGTKEYDHSDHNPVACFKRNLIYKKSEYCKSPSSVTSSSAVWQLREVICNPIYEILFKSSKSFEISDLQQVITLYGDKSPGQLAKWLVRPWEREM